MCKTERQNRKGVQLANDEDLEQGINHMVQWTACIQSIFMVAHPIKEG